MLLIAVYAGGMSDEEFEQLVSQGINALRPDIRAQLENVAIVVADEPSEQQRQELRLDANEDVFGLYEGTPRTERSVEDGYMLPDKITIFRRAILDAYTDPADIAQCVENTVWHEVAHHFGLDEEAVRAQEQLRGKEL